jgi:DNA-binding NarL/FixJ family response regulator
VAENPGTALIVGGDGRVRSSLKKLLERAGFDSIEAESGQDALALVHANHPWLVVLDVSLPDITGYQVCKQIRDDFGENVSIVFLSSDRTEPIDRATGLLVGGDDYLAEPFDPVELLARVRRLDERRRGELAIPHEPAADLPELTRRELDVLRLLAQGNRTKDISRTLGISAKTVSSHAQHLFAKLGVNSRAQAVALAYRSGLVTTLDEVATSSR